MARGASDRGKRIAFGDGRRIIWDKNSGVVFRNNPHVASPGDERANDLEWIAFHKGHRVYNTHDVANDRWIWNYGFRPIPGEVFLDKMEKFKGERAGQGFILIEPHVETWKSSAANKDWGFNNYQVLAAKLFEAGHRVVQFAHDATKPVLSSADVLTTTSFRDAMALMAHASLYIGPEGGSHHAAAAMGLKGVVIFGGFIPPQVTGYPEMHTNITGGVEACGSLRPCPHCRAAMRGISVEEVFEAAVERLKWST